MKNVYSLLFSFLFFTAAACAEPAGKIAVLLKTSQGDITLELDAAAAPETTKNFLQYVDDGFYNNTVFHRVIPNFMIQGGGFDPGMQEKPTRAPIKNESGNGLKNSRGTIAMARTQNPDSASAQFFINLVDNTYLDGSPIKPGYAVFGKVTHGIEIVDKIAVASTASRGMHQDVPMQDILILSATRITATTPNPLP